MTHYNEMLDLWRPRLDHFCDVDIEACHDVVWVVQHGDVDIDDQSLKFFGEDQRPLEMHD